MPLNLFSLTGLKQLALKISPWLIIIVVIYLTALYAQHKWNQAIELSYNNGVKDGKQTVVNDYENKAAQLRNNWAIDKGKLEYEAQQRLNAVKADADRARDTADSLQRTIDKVRSIASSAGVSVSSSTTTAKAVTLLADMLIESNRAANTYAEYADAASEAGRTCELQYDAMRNRILEQQTFNRPATVQTR